MGKPILVTFSFYWTSTQTLWFSVDSGKKNVYKFFITVLIYVWPSANTLPKWVYSNSVIFLFRAGIFLTGIHGIITGQKSSFQQRENLSSRYEYTVWTDIQFYTSPSTFISLGTTNKVLKKLFYWILFPSDKLIFTVSLQETPSELG